MALNISESSTSVRGLQSTDLEPNGWYWCEELHEVVMVSAVGNIFSVGDNIRNLAPNLTKGHYFQPINVDLIWSRK